MNHLDLFSGIGGFGLAARWSGYATVGFCEIDPWCRRVIAKHWPETPIHDDIKTLTGDIVRGWAGGSRIDLITGGFPCQPVSVAGLRLGKEDDRYLWPEMRRVIAEVMPRRILGENVAGIVTMGLDAVLSDLEALGYACWPVVIPAAAVGAPHRRDRVWILADSNTGRESQPQGSKRHVGRRLSDGGADVADAHGGRLQASDTSKRGLSVVDPEGYGRRNAGETIGGMGDEAARLSGRMARPGWRVGPDVLNPWAGDWEGDMPRTTEYEKDRVNKLKALGNAIVPQVAYEILRAWGDAS